MSSAANTQGIQNVEALGNPPKSIGEWTLRQKRGRYYELVRREGKKVRTLYVGRDWTRSYQVLSDNGEPVSEKPDAKGETLTVQAEQVTEEPSAGPDETVSREGLPCKNGDYCRFHEQEYCWFSMSRKCIAPAVKAPEAPKARTGGGRWGA